MRGSYLFLFIASLTLILFPDEPRRSDCFFSNNRKYQFRPVDLSASYWGVVKIPGQILEYKILSDRYSFPGQFASQKVYLSDDGRYLTIIDDWSEVIELQFPVIRIYYNGHAIKFFYLRDILDRVDNISSSVSHAEWFFWKRFKIIPDEELSFTTFELKRITINIRTGDLSKRVLGIVKPDSVFVYGPVKKLENNKYQVEVYHHVLGKVPENGKLSFFYSGNRQFYTSYMAVLINNGILDTRLWNIGGYGLILNEGNFGKNKIDSLFLGNK